MGSLTQVLLAPVDGGDRWGDYYDIAIDPNDDFTFWAIGGSRRTDLGTRWSTCSAHAKSRGGSSLRTCHGRSSGPTT